jgi:hypothetical protein
VALTSVPPGVAAAWRVTLRWQNTTVIADDVPEQIAKLKTDTDGVILVAGSGTLVGSLLFALRTPRRAEAEFLRTSALGVGIEVLESHGTSIAQLRDRECATAPPCSVEVVTEAR